MGSTGAACVDLTEAELDEVLRQRREGTWPSGPPVNVGGIDVDAYRNKRGQQTLAAAEAEWGPPPLRGQQHPGGAGRAGLCCSSSLLGIRALKWRNDMVLTWRPFVTAIDTLSPCLPFVLPGGPIAGTRRLVTSTRAYLPGPEEFSDLPERWAEALTYLGAHRHLHGIDRAALGDRCIWVVSGIALG